MAAEADLAVDFDDGDALVEPLAELRVGVDVDARGCKAMHFEQLEGIVAQMAACDACRARLPERPVFMVRGFPPGGQCRKSATCVSAYFHPLTHFLVPAL